jgi:hypothetical protein
MQTLFRNEGDVAIKATTFDVLTIYRWYFLSKFEQFSWVSYTTPFKIRRYQRPF